MIPELPFDTRLANFMAVLDEARTGGVTTIQDLTRAPQVRVYREVQRRGDLTCRIQLRPMLDMVEHVDALGISEGIGDDWIKFIGLKAWVDGIMGSSGAMFFDPYSTARVSGENRAPPHASHGTFTSGRKLISIFLSPCPSHTSQRPPRTLNEKRAGP